MGIIEITRVRVFALAFEGALSRAENPRCEIVIKLQMMLGDGFRFFFLVVVWGGANLSMKYENLMQ